MPVQFLWWRSKMQHGNQPPDIHVMRSHILFCSSLHLKTVHPDWPYEQHSQLRITKQYLPPFESLCTIFSPNAFVNVSMSRWGISWCSESYFSEPHCPLCCKHLCKGQVQCLRGVLLVSSPVRRSNEPSNQCYLFIAQWHTADVVSYGVIQAS